VCAFDPPKIQLIPSNGGMSVVSFQSPVAPDEWCGKWIANTASDMSAPIDPP